MAKKWDGSKVIKEIDEALDRATAQFLTNTRSVGGVSGLTAVWPVAGILAATNRICLPPQSEKRWAQSS